MAKAESYDDLIFQLGDLARDRLASRPAPPRSMARVFKAEDAVVARRAELEDLERQMNEEDAGYADFLDRQEAERGEQQEIVKKWKRAVEAIEGRSKELRKRLSTKRATVRYEAAGLKTTETKHRDLEMTSHHDQAKVQVSRDNLKKLRLLHMRKQRDIEEVEAELAQVLTPRPGQPGAQGILAHKRLLDMEDESELRKEEHEQMMADLDAAIAAKEAETTAAEDYLDQALFLLGEECYTQRLADPALAALYPKIDRAAG